MVREPVLHFCETPSKSSNFVKCVQIIQNLLEHATERQHEAVQNMLSHFKNLCYRRRINTEEKAKVVAAA